MSVSNTNKKIIEKYLEQFYLENDPEALKNGFDNSGLAQFTIENGIDSLNRLLFDKYGNVIDFETDESADIVAKRKSSVIEFDQEMLRDELKVFYTEMRDFKQLSVLKEVVEWTRKYGIENLDKQFEELYGISLTNFYVKAAEEGLKVNEERKKVKDDISVVIKVNKRISFNIKRKKKKYPLPCCLNIILVGKV